MDSNLTKSLNRLRKANAVLRVEKTRQKSQIRGFKAKIRQLRIRKKTSTRLTQTCDAQVGMMQLVPKSTAKSTTPGQGDKISFSE